jgi:hypothetical protein
MRSCADSPDAGCSGRLHGKKVDTSRRSGYIGRSDAAVLVGHLQET